MTFCLEIAYLRRYFNGKSTSGWNSKPSTFWIRIVGLRIQQRREVLHVMAFLRQFLVHNLAGSRDHFRNPRPDLPVHFTTFMELLEPQVPSKIGQKFPFRGKIWKWKTPKKLTSRVTVRA